MLVWLPSLSFSSWQNTSNIFSFFWMHLWQYMRKNLLKANENNICKSYWEKIIERIGIEPIISANVSITHVPIHLQTIILFYLTLFWWLLTIVGDFSRVFTIHRYTPALKIGKEFQLFICYILFIIYLLYSFYIYLFYLFIIIY